MDSGSQHGIGLSPLSGGPNVGTPSQVKRPWSGSSNMRSDNDGMLNLCFCIRPICCNWELIRQGTSFARGKDQDECGLQRSRRMWTPTGWKSDNGFRAGYLSKIDDSLRSEFPNTDLKGNPHINSKMGAWKKSYGLLRSILSRTGVGWNHHGDYKFDCSDEQWEQIVQTIFGKDRASGMAAEEIGAAAKSLRAQVSGSSQVNENDYHPSFEDFIPEPYTPLSNTNEVPIDSSDNSGKHKSTSKPVPRKIKKPSPNSELMEFLGNLHERTDARLEMISKRIGYEFDMGQARQEVFDKLGTVEGLTLSQRYRLCNILGDKPQRLEVFIGMPVNARLGYLLCLIEEQQKEL
ncbi:hypothetical protein SASPL_136710 [Salvia splendens]|uniref:Myb/SANT-like domain-containing protein n=1 Tax=Salvia splendens TaxID=180675 RepID=A0A8X8ZGV6_SALSN|nr:hypothetical protein SASPL_136710 [Salvia splendens]